MSVGEWFQRYNDKARLKQAFIAAKLTYTRQVGQTKHVMLPIIHSVKYFEDRTELVFTLINGISPQLVDKHAFVFRQFFGRNTQVTGDLKRFVINVYHRDMPDSYTYTFAQSKHRLPIICGINRQGAHVSYDMSETPHVLISGETGAGKSTQLRAVITNLVLSRKPEQLRLVMGDLKMSEFHIFRGLAHVDSVNYNAKDLQAALGKVATELTRRGELLNRHELTHISELPDPPPAIVVCVDEFALLRDDKTIMAVIEDISAIGRALDVFLILSQQRADNTVMNGRLKQNLTVRMAFRAADEINSRITIGSGEAANIGISERGRFYMKRERLELLQGPFLDADKARALLKPYKVQPSDTDHTSQKIADPLGLLGGGNNA